MMTLKMHEYEYSSMSTITLECNLDHFHDYFNEFPVSPVKATLMEYVCFILVMLLCHYIVFQLITAITFWL